MIRNCCLALIVGLLARSEMVVAQPGPPPGSGNYFGAPRDAAFNPNTLLPAAKPAAGTPPALVPVVPADPGLPPAPQFGGPDGLLPARQPAPKLWNGGVDLGLNGASGNADLFNLRAAFNAHRKTTDNIFDTDFLYTYTRSQGTLAQHQALFNARDEILFAGSPWSLFGSTNIEYDELRAYNFRIGLYGGVGRILIDDAAMTWRLRAGAGAVREIGQGGNASRWVPEAVFGSDYSYRFDERQSFVVTVDYYPRIDQWSQYRVRARAAYQILIDPASGMILKLGIQDRYDSNPGNARANDITYFATLGFTF